MVIAAAFWTASVLTDRQTLNENLIRFHVIANSDSDRDQQIKLKVRDAVLESLQEDLKSVADVEAAKAYIRENLPKVEAIANQVLADWGFTDPARAQLCREEYDTRYYDTFCLPAGIYESLQIIIGEGKGQNWWCVAFPTFCVPATSAGFSEVAAGAGFSNALTDTLTGEERYEVRFFLLDKLGQIQKRFSQG